jgi:hypothetical protein
VPVESAKLTRYIKDLGLSHKETTKSFIFCCPLCGGKDKLYIRKSDGRFRCFRCATDNGFSGNPEYALIELTGSPLSTVKAALYGSTQEQASFLDVSPKDFFDSQEEEIAVAEQLPSLTWPYHCIPILHGGARKGLEYLQGRGINPEVADTYRIRYSPQSRAVVFPVYSGESLVGWQYRTIDPTKFLVDGCVKETAKAWSSPNLPRDKVFMFSERLKGSKHAVLCEGPIDCLKVHLVGGNVAAMGKAISSAHIATVLRSGIKTVYAGLDPDAFGELDHLMSKLDGISLYRVIVPDRKDGSKSDLGALSMEDAYKAVMSSELVNKSKLYIWMKPLHHHQMGV